MSQLTMMPYFFNERIILSPISSSVIVVGTSSHVMRKAWLSQATMPLLPSVWYTERQPERTLPVRAFT